MLQIVVRWPIGLVHQQKCSSTETHVVTHLVSGGSLGYLVAKRSIVASPSEFNMTCQAKYSTVRTRIKIVIATVHTDLVISTMHSADYLSTNTKSGIVHSSE